MKRGYTLVSGRGQTDPLLARVAEVVTRAGLNCAGTIQYNSMPEDMRLCDMDVRVLPAGPTIRISESRGPEACGCRLDPSALETAVSLTLRALETSPDLLIINKFGKHEAGGRGFRNAIAKALEKDIPVLIGVNALNEDAFNEFTANCAEFLEPNEEGILSWIAGATDMQLDAA
ncbi:MAG: DUF2478 domain-containing protein [Pseudomonadota bacterium]